MQHIKVSLPAGTRDFSATTLYKRNYITSTIAKHFKAYGFSPLETPAIENLETLSGKYGDEGDQLMFKILNNGLGQHKKPELVEEAFQQVMNGGNSNALLTERALRYDLTIPLARYVAMQKGQLTFPFKRYQIQPVWRADKPQKGRYREFMQCDADIIGEDSLWHEIDLIHLYLDVFDALHLSIELQLNHRKILQALQQKCEVSANDSSLMVAIDKIDKIGIEAVLKQLQEQGLKQAHLDTVERYLRIEGNPHEQIEQVQHLLGDTPLIQQAVDDLQFILKHIHHPKSAQLKLQLRLARGLDYYTACIMEVKNVEGSLTSSIGGGGRYNNLTSLFCEDQISGVGISFGVDRIYDSLEELQKFPSSLSTDQSTKVLFFHMGDQVVAHAYAKMQELRKKGIACELYTTVAKVDKQFKYAERKNIPYVIIIGEKEMHTQQYTVKNRNTREQFLFNWEETTTYLLT